MLREAFENELHADGALFGGSRREVLLDRFAQSGDRFQRGEMLSKRRIVRNRDAVPRSEPFHDRLVKRMDLLRGWPHPAQPGAVFDPFLDLFAPPLSRAAGVRWR